ncbi:Acyl-CoA--sterol O-acyltransferase 1 [Camellia lanceoleosa]|uniref:Acyl-CoA--sterol O-acyltransferase 1 n=1 Tax=Camellia lanceoleosa TaxID=1840588 RepID=A0ACC0GLP1_9ERIC|nr:Acyl-CoA--sterol O-acyltransferase 1 [Camellia lanceoleosa]
MEDEMSNYMKVWFEVLVSMCYCYLVTRIGPKGTIRLISFLPVVCLFLVLPLNLTSIHFGLTTAFFITWLANFKLLLLAFGIGPLSDPSLSLGQFFVVACLPIKIQQNPPTKPPPSLVKPLKNNHNLEKPLNGLRNGSPSPTTSKSGLKSPLNYATKALFSAFFLYLNNYYKEYLHPKLFQFCFVLYVYMGLEILLAVVATMAQVVLGSNVEAQFDEPYLSSSLRDFWGRRWNLMSSDILRLTIYNPLCSLARPVLGHKWAYILAIIGTFLVSGLMHELMFYYAGMRHTWGHTLFFLLQGLCLIVESSLKKFIGAWPLHRQISGPLIFGFVIITYIWLVMPNLLMFNVDVRANKEYEAVVTFFKDRC